MPNHVYSVLRPIKIEQDEDGWIAPAELSGRMKQNWRASSLVPKATRSDVGLPLAQRTGAGHWPGSENMAASWNRLASLPWTEKPAPHTETSPAWEHLTFSSLSDVILIIGAPDTGKTTFARYLYHRLSAHHEQVAFVDGDVGQATLGPPTTMTLALGKPGDDSFPHSGKDPYGAWPPAGPHFCTFVGDVSPRGRMLPIVVGAHKLAQKARKAGATAIVFDTTGLVNPAQGGGALKRAKVELLRPGVVVGIQHKSELEHLLLPLRRSRRTRVIDLRVARAVRRRSATVRQEHRATRFRLYFEDAHTLKAEWWRLAVFPAPAFKPNQLLALEDIKGFTLALGIVTASDPVRNMITLYTPLSSLAGVDAIRLGDLALDPHTFRETRFR